MRIATVVARYLLGLIFFVFGVNGFVDVIPHPPLGPTATQYMEGLTVTGYFWPLLRGLEALGGLALLSNRFVPLALAALAPINLQIFAFHLALEPLNLPMAGVMIVAHALLLAAYWPYFAPLFTARATSRYSAALARADRADAGGLATTSSAA